MLNYIYHRTDKCFNVGFKNYLTSCKFFALLADSIEDFYSNYSIKLPI